MRKTRVMVFGTFDGLHEGHLDFFKQARVLKSLAYEQSKNFTENSFLIVSIARDENVIRIKNRKPRLSEKERFNLVKECKMVDKVVLAGKDDYLKHILKEKPDIIALGYDQKAYVKELKEDLKNKGISIKIIRLKPYQENIYKNHLIHKKNLL